MKVFAKIDGGTIVSSVEKSFLPGGDGEEYEIDYLDQLIIENGKIKVDKKIPDRNKLYKESLLKQSRLVELKNIIQDFVIEKELYSNQITNSLKYDEEEYKNILIEYNNLLKEINEISKEL
jgi:hypothetical protein